MSGTTFDVVILGGGSGGYAAALRGAQLGLSVALIEKDKLGGTCLHYGCIPTKALLHAAEVADSARESEQFGVSVTLEGVDLVKVNAYRDGVVSRLYKGLQGLVKSRAVTFVEGTGRLTSPTTVDVAGTTYTATKGVVLATGSYARTLPGLEIGGRVITSYEALTLDTIPAKVVVLGGGVIGVEFASVWRSFGAEVTVVEALPRLVPNEDEACSKALDRAFRKRGITSKVGVRFAGRDPVRLGRGRLPRGRHEARGRPAARGRRPRSQRHRDGLRGGRRRAWTAASSSPTTASPPTCPASTPSATSSRACSSRTAGSPRASSSRRRSPASPRASIDEMGIPRVTYCEPEVASVGLTQAQAVEKYGADQVEAYEYNLGGNGKSQILGTTGFVKLVREKDGPVVGVHMVGARVGELVGEGQLVVNWEAYPEDVASLVHAHPTQNEAFGEAFLALAGKPLHAHA